MVLLASDLNNEWIEEGQVYILYYYISFTEAYSVVLYILFSFFLLSFSPSNQSWQINQIQIAICKGEIRPKASKSETKILDSTQSSKWSGSPDIKWTVDILLCVKQSNYALHIKSCWILGWRSKILLTLLSKKIENVNECL
jgi:hypothetical protein